jgi:Ca2+-binding RTX toxin-like protein
VNGGPGRDLLYGGRDNDSLYDGELDSEAAVDRFDGGSERSLYGDRLNFAMRSDGMTIDLASGVASTGDTLVDVESVTAGRGDDRVFGNDDGNWLSGGAGVDEIFGRGDRDRVQGGAGDDVVAGDDGDDDVDGNTGADSLAGGEGDDALDGLEEHGRARPDEISCDAGADTAESDNLDTLTTECELLIAFDDYLTMGTVPPIDGDSADFTVKCVDLPRCRGTISLRGSDGRLYGSAPFDFLPDDVAQVVVVVELQADAILALQAGTLVRVDVDSAFSYPPAGGYRMFLRLSPAQLIEG